MTQPLKRLNSERYKRNDRKINRVIKGFSPCFFHSQNLHLYVNIDVVVFGGFIRSKINARKVAV